VARDVVGVFAAEASRLRALLAAGVLAGLVPFARLLTALAAFFVSDVDSAPGEL
jgi:hypothetical protein